MSLMYTAMSISTNVSMTNILQVHAAPSLACLSEAHKISACNFMRDTACEVSSWTAYLAVVHAGNGSIVGSGRVCGVRIGGGLEVLQRAAPVPSGEQQQPRILLHHGPAGLRATTHPYAMLLAGASK